MAKCAVATGSPDCSKATLDVYLERFRSWDYELFESAMADCRSELTRFPSIAQIVERLPKVHPTAPDIVPEQYESIFGITEQPIEKNELEDELDALSDDEITELFKPVYELDPNAKYPLTPDLETQLIKAKYAMGEFRKHPKGMIFRGTLRDMLKLSKKLTI